MIELTGYQIIDRIYSGTRTLVYRGFRTDDKQPVAIKVLHSEYPSFSELVQFRNQYTIAKNLNLPGIIQTYSLEPYRNGYALIVEDFGGISLKEWTGKGKTVKSLVEFFQIAIALSNTLDILGNHCIIHKDIKPANILINPQTKQIKLIDFSIASLLPRETQEIYYNPNVLEGTIAYISPEQTGRMNRGVDYRTDFYSLGVTFYELLTGNLPFQSQDPMELVHYHIAKQPPSLRQETNPQSTIKSVDIPQAIANIVMKLMAKNAEERYQSALGLKHDLETCFAQLQATGKIEHFELGQRDICDRFLIPEKLYGREIEVQKLLAAFDRVATPLSSTLSNGRQRGGELILVSGFSGIGKTAVVNEVHKPIVRQRGYFIKGKFDQFNRNIPFSAFVQAFRDLMGQLLSESDTQLQTWKTQILEAVGENGQVIVEVIPELERIIGTQSVATKLSGTAAQNRFNSLFEKFLQVFTKPEHPLVIFLDDLQWADSASLNLMQLLMASETGYLLLIGAYRDNEVSGAHPLMLTLDSVSKTEAIVSTIALKPLSPSSLNQLVADTLNCDTALAQPLTAFIAQKTQGNPFFATQFLKALHQDKLIKFDSQVGHWECDIVGVREAALTDDVVEFMALQLQKLPLETQAVLKLAACIGNEFDLKTLAIAFEQSETETSTTLWQALQEGLILPQSEVYKFYIQRETQDLVENSQIALYRFLHDRIQQAAYSLIPEYQKSQIHLKIGRLLLAKSLSANRAKQVFLLVNQLNLGRALINQLSEQLLLAQLNLEAGDKAIASTAYEAAVDYCRTGIELLPPDCWDRQDTLTRKLHQGLAQAACLCSQFELMDRCIDTALQHSPDFLTALPMQDIRLQGLKLQSRFSEAIALGRSLLETLGITFPSQPQPQDIIMGLQEVQAKLADRSIEDLLESPAIDDPYKLAASYLLLRISPAAFLGDPMLFPLLVLAQTKLGLDNGHAAPHTHGYANYAMLVGGMLGDKTAAYEFGQLALQLIDRYEARELAAMTTFLVNLFTQHWHFSAHQIVEKLQQTYTLAIETGDYEHATYSAFNYCNLAYLAGNNLATVHVEMEKYSQWMGQIGEAGIGFAIHQANHQGILSLEGKIPAPSFPIDWEQINPGIPVFIYYIHNQLVYSYLFGDYHTAQRIASLLDRCDPITRTQLVVIVTEFYAVLADLALEPSTQPEKSALGDRIQSKLTQLEQRASQAPMNFQHKYDLVAAEHRRVLGERIEAIDLYDLAISGAKANKYIQEEALANELAAKFYLDWGKEKVASGYMQEAYYCYARWGAKAKTDDLENRYPNLLRPILYAGTESLTILETLTTITALAPHSSINTSTNPTQSSSTSINTALDFATLLKAFQSLSETIQLEQLLHQLSQIILQNSGAERFVMIVPNEAGEWYVQVIATLDEIDISAAPLEGHEALPIKLIQYVKNTQEVVVIDNLKTDLPVIDEYLLQRQPKSILCLPVLHQSQLRGIVYLKNKRTSGAFTRDRILTLNFLCTQAAISIENAKLYQREKEKSDKLAQQEKQYRSIFESVTDGLSIVDLETGITIAINPTVCKIFGYSEAEFLALSPPDFVIAEELSIFAKFIETVRGGQIFNHQGRCIRKDGTIFDIEIKATSCDYNGKRHALVIFRDISDRKHAEAALAESEAKFRRLVEGANDMIWSAQADGIFTYLSPQFETMFGFPPSDWVGKSLTYLIHPDDLEMALAPAKVALEQGTNQQDIEFRHLCQDGSYLWVTLNMTPIKDTEGHAIGLQGIVRDISDRKNAETIIQQKTHALEQALQELQQAQLHMVQSEKMSALGNLVAGVAHEINNPVGCIVGNVGAVQDALNDLFGLIDLYQKKFPTPDTEIEDELEAIDLEYLREDLPKLIKAMKDGADRITSISKSLRTFSRNDSDTKQLFNLHEGIDSTVLILRHRLKANEHRPAIEVVTEYGKIPGITCFPGQLNQVFMNILANAIDALDESNSGRSFAEIKAHPNRIEIRTNLESEGVKVRIADNGKGMSSEVKSHIFDHLFTTKRVGKGTGLGLAIARQIVEEKHGGTIEVASTLSEGTEFVISLPIKGHISTVDS
ncbi:MAG: PAS domain S-box protein [Microcoleus sp. PH2017_07_MST_O_A]|nr:PAS domain S-box protein [Microcoleus sp. PH2017_07_MST_O_A]MCC3512398.1 PAS domain S-box protein [Microcoleus sp. PH2017_17_BER_D_A]